MIDEFFNGIINLLIGLIMIIFIILTLYRVVTGPDIDIIDNILDSNEFSIIRVLPPNYGEMPSGIVKPIDLRSGCIVEITNNSSVRVIMCPQ